MLWLAIQNKATSGLSSKIANIMKKSKLIPIGLLLMAVGLHCLHLSIENFSGQIKLGFVSKILLIVGVVSIFLFWFDHSKVGKGKSRK